MQEFLHLHNVVVFFLALITSDRHQFPFFNLDLFVFFHSKGRFPVIASISSLRQGPTAIQVCVGTPPNSVKPESVISTAGRPSCFAFSYMSSSSCSLLTDTAIFVNFFFNQSRTYPSALSVYRVIGVTPSKRVCSSCSIIW